MESRAIWKGNIRFGIFDVPVKLHTAVREERIRFHLLHKTDHIKLKQQMVCAYERTPVPVEGQTRGFELDEGKYILVDPEELEQIGPEENRVIEVREFVKAGLIDPLFLDRVYYLEPQHPSKTYAALGAALKELDVEGICAWTMRKRSYIGALRVQGKFLRLQTLRYADEVISTRFLNLPKAALSQKELKIGSDLIEQLTDAFDPLKFENEHEKKLQDLIDKKVRGEKVAILRPKHLKPTAPDKLLETLEASLRKVG